MEIVPLVSPTETQDAQMLEIFCASFAQEPGFRYMFQHPKRRASDIEWAARLKYALVRSKVECFVALEEASIQGFGWWMPPGVTPFSSLWQQIRVGYGWAPVRCGLAGFRRMLRFSSQERVLIEKYTAAPIWMLDTIAVDLSLGRRGLGGRLLQVGLERAKETGHDCFVLTHNERNVRFYQKYGFQLQETEPLVGTGVDAYCLLWQG